jgi:lysozyme
VGNLRHSTLIRRVYAGDHAAVSGQFGKWTLAAGKELPGLAKRRAAEAALYQEAA